MIGPVEFVEAYPNESSVALIMARDAEWQARVDRLEATLKEAVDCYGKPGGPWNVPSDPGGWLERARAALRKAGQE